MALCSVWAACSPSEHPSSHPLPVVFLTPYEKKRCGGGSGGLGVCVWVGGGLTGHAPQGRSVKRVPRDSSARDRHVAAGRRSAVVAGARRSAEQSGTQRSSGFPRQAGWRSEDRPSGNHSGVLCLCCWLKIKRFVNKDEDFRNINNKKRNSTNCFARFSFALVAIV